MPGKLIGAKTGHNALTTEPKNLAFSSDFELNKIAKIKRFTSQGSTNHGFNYAPKFMSMREISSSPLKMGWGNMCEVDDEKIYSYIGTHTTDFSYDNYQSESDSATWAIIFVDNLTEGNFKKEIHGGVILVGNGDSDYDYKIHSKYDTFKVMTTGRLTVNASQYDNGSAGGVRITSATYNHNLGYVPIFAPFVNYKINKDEYLSWNGQYNTQNYWTSGYLYHIGEEAYDEDAGKLYRCKKTHIASASNKPESGAEWTTYWDYSIDRNEIWQSGKYYNVGDTVATEWYGWFRCIVAHTSNSTNEPPMGDYWDTYWEYSYNPHDYNTYLNNLEDMKLVYGGVELYNYSTFLYYATETQLVLSLVQTQAPDMWTDDHQYLIYEHEPCPAETVYVDYTIFYNKINEEFDLISD